MRRWVMPLNLQCLQDSVKNKECSAYPTTTWTQRKPIENRKETAERQKHLNLAYSYNFYSWTDDQCIKPYFYYLQPNTKKSQQHSTGEGRNIRLSALDKSRYKMSDRCSPHLQIAFISDVPVLVYSYIRACNMGRCLNKPR